MNQTATWDVPFREAGARTGKRPTIIHLAEREENYERALCGYKRGDWPLEPNAQGELCIVCRELHFRKHGYEIGKAP